MSFRPFSYPLLNSDLSIVLGHSDDVATLKAIQTIARSMSALKQADDQAIKPSYLSSEWDSVVERIKTVKCIATDIENI